MYVFHFRKETLTSDDPAMVNLIRPQSFELTFVVDMDRIVSNGVIFVNYEQKSNMTYQFYRNLPLSYSMSDN